MKTLIISLLSMVVSVTSLVYTWRSDESNTKYFNWIQEIYDTQQILIEMAFAPYANAGNSTQQLQDMQDKVDSSQANLNNLNEFVQATFDGLIHLQNRIDAAEGTITYLCNVPEKNK